MEVRRAAIGRVAKMGDLYDIRSDTFCGTNMFSRPPPLSAIREINAENSELELLENDVLSDKFSQLQVEPELRMSILTGLCSVDGSALCLLDEKSSASSVQNTLCLSVQTKIEQLDLFDDNLLDTIFANALDVENATHIVVEVIWGAHTLISVEYLVEKNSDQAKIEEFQDQMRILASSGGDAEQAICRKKENNRVSVKIFGDLLPDEYASQTMEAALALMKKIPVLLQQSGSGKGKPISYAMVPISILQEHLGRNKVPNVVFCNLRENTMMYLEDTFNEIQRAKQHINDIYLDFTMTDESLPDGCVEEILLIRKNFQLEEEKLRLALKCDLVAVRTGRESSDVLDSSLHAYVSQRMSPKNVMKLLDRFTKINEKLALKRVLNKEEVYCVTRTTDVNDIVAKNGMAEVYLLYHSDALEAQNPELWASNWQAFLSLLELRKKNDVQNDQVFIFVDQDGKPGSKYTEKLSIRHMQGRTILSKDLVAEYAASAGLCVAKSMKPVASCTSKPNKRVHIEFRCPGSFFNKCNEEACIWLCHKCHETLEFGFDSYLYCSCGCADYKSFGFKCRSLSHGFSFLTFESKILEEFITSLQPLKEINILILGETGVGKSTWINGFVNYLTYSTLEDAEQGENVNLIPACFTMTNENYEEITISTGSADNENTAAGQSATQHPKSYVFVRGKNIVRLIDTPGIGDTRGIDQDKKNFQHILTHLSHLEEIHGICILLKPNNSRLTAMFQFCVKELLTHLHRDASRNIVFCFTNARSTFYQPGDTLPPLRKLLQDNKQVTIPLTKQTIYCVDNESVRFLAALKQGLAFDSSMRQNYSVSWNKSVEETDRLISHIESLEPHKTRSTLSLNEARRIIVAMTEPLAAIGKNIDDNIAVVRDKQEEIHLSKCNKEELVGKLYVPVIDLEPVELDHPRTVCTSSHCIKVYEIDGNTKTDYAQVCHPHCYLPDVEVSRYPCTELKHCWAFNGVGLNCRACECIWEKHMHVTYECKQVEIQVTNNTVQQLINGKIDVIKAVEETMAKLEDQIKALHDEKAHVVRVSSKFAHFLKVNAITPYNDAMEEYLLMLIRQEKDKIAVGGDRKSLDSLENMLAAYKEEVAILEAAMNSSSSHGVDTIHPDDIATLAQSLYELPISGKAFKQYMTVMENTAASSAQYNEIRYQRPMTSSTTSTKENKGTSMKYNKSRGKQPKADKEWQTVRNSTASAYNTRTINAGASRGTYNAERDMSKKYSYNKADHKKMKNCTLGATSGNAAPAKPETSIVKRILNYVWRN